MMLYLLLSTPLLAALVAGLSPRSRRSAIEYASVVAGLLEVAVALLIASRVLELGVVRASAMLEADALSAFVVLFVSVVGFASALHSVGHLREETRKDIVGFRRVRQYFVLFHLFFFAMFAAAISASPVLMWAAVEATTLASAFLVTFYNKPSALEAGWKFLIINSVGLLLGFFGTLLFLSAAARSGAQGAFVTWDTLYALGSSLDPTLIKVAFVFVLIGFGTKVGFVPMHTWLPDAHSKAPIPVSSLLSGVLLNIALVGILRFRIVADAALDPAFSQHLLVGFGIVSLVVSALIIFVQKNYKRLLAYSSIEHMGIMALGFGVGGLATVAALFHMLYHALLKPILFFAAGNIFLKYGSTKISQVRGALTLLPLSAGAFLAGALAITGMPPSGMFFTELAIFSSAMRSYPYLVLIALLALFIVFAGFLRHGAAMLFSGAPNDLPKGEANRWVLVSIGFLFTLFAVLSVFVPAPLADLLGRAAALIN